MAGFNSIEGNTFGSVMYADNASFDGTPRGGVISADGQLWIGSSVAPYVRKGTLTAGTGITITNGNGSITIANSSPGSALTITGNTGGAISPSAGNWNLVTANTTVKIAGSGSTLTQDFNLTNLLIGVPGTSIAGAIANVSLGKTALSALSSGTGNVAIGELALNNVSAQSSNTAVGYSSLNACTNSTNTAVGAFSCQTLGNAAANAVLGYQAGRDLTTGGNNTLLGFHALLDATTAANNVCVGSEAGNAYLSSESNNICIGTNVFGTVGESNIIRIGTTSHTQTYLQGVVNMPKGQVVAVTSPGAYPYTTLATDYVILVDTTAARTINLIGSPVTGQTYRIKDNVGSAATNNITITPAAGNIDGAASYVISTNYASVDLVYNGTQWNVL